MFAGLWIRIQKCFYFQVCSPGGSTIRGVEQLEKGGVRAAMMAAVKAAAERNEELGKK